MHLISNKCFTSFISVERFISQRAWARKDIRADWYGKSLVPFRTMKIHMLDQRHRRLRNWKKKTKTVRYYTYTSQNLYSAFTKVFFCPIWVWTEKKGIYLKASSMKQENLGLMFEQVDLCRFFEQLWRNHVRMEKLLHYKLILYELGMYSSS
jgi:hypothetical protein